MSTYTKTTNFTAKDNLTSGDPAKVIKGSEFDTEFNAIETAVNSKADKNNGVHTGTTTIATANIDTLQIDGVAVTSTSVELNKLDGFTGDVTDLNKLAGVTATSTELNLLDGVTATTAELNFVDGVTSNVQTQLNAKQPLDAQLTDIAGLTPVDGTFIVGNGTNFVAESGDTAIASLGVTATATELNTLDGITATTTELNYTDGVTSNIQTQLNAMVEKAGDTMTGDLSLGDNVKAKFGASDDLQIYHDGSASYIADTGSGTLNIKASGSIRLRGNDTDELLARFNENGSNQFYYDNAEKLATTSTGVDVTGTISADALDIAGAITADGLTVEGSSTGTLNSVNFLNTNNGATATANRLGLGISNSAGSNYTYIEAKELGVDAFAEMNFYTGVSPTKRMTLGTYGDVSFYEDTGTTAKMVWDASAERLGIGTSSPSSALEVNSGTSNITQKLKSTDDGCYLQFNDNNALGFYIGAKGGAFTFYSTNNAERARIDSSGNLLVGKTGYNIADNGIALRPNEATHITRDGGIPFYLNRKTSDGAIQEFRKDGSTVGSIGTYLGDLTVGNEDTGLLYHNADNAIKPWHVTANLARNGVTDLGDANHRFKDLHLSGGVYLGGTGAANKLDDYETGSWSPDVNLVGAVIDSNTNAEYVKIGDIVHIRGFLKLSTVGTGSALQITGLPFTPTAGGYGRSAISMQANFLSISSGYGVMGLVGEGSTSNFIEVLKNTTSGNTDLSVSEISTSSGFYFAGWYQA